MTKPNEEEKEVVDLEEIPESEESVILEPMAEVSEDDFDGLMPSMNVGLPVEQQPKDCTMLISDQQYLGVLDEIMSNIREDRKQVSDYLDNFADMVINDGDATTSSKEALVNLVKIKTDMADKMAKVADLMTRLKVKNTYANSGAHMNAVQQNNINIGTDATEFSRKELIRAINHAKKKKD